MPDSTVKITEMGALARVNHPAQEDEDEDEVAFQVNWDYAAGDPAKNRYASAPDHPQHGKFHNAGFKAFQRAYFLTGAVPRPPAALPRGVVIVGAGAFGLTAALHMARRGIKPIHVLESDDEIADTPYDNANDYQLHTPVASDYAPCGEGAAHYKKLFNESMANFIHDLVLKNYLHVMGYAYVAPPGSTREAHEAVQEAGDEAMATAGATRTVQRLVHLDGTSALQDETDLAFLSGGLPFTGYVNRRGAVLQTAEALYRLYIEALKLGVRFTFNERVDALWWDGMGQCKGVVASEHSRIYTGDAVVVTVGARIPGVVPAAGGQLAPTAYVVAYIELTLEEVACLAGIPVLHVPDLGYLCPPHTTFRLMQVCSTSWEWEYGGPDGRPTVPDWTDHLPPRAERRMRKLLRVTFPWLERRELVRPRMVWTARTTDGHFLMDKVPGTENVYVAVGDMDKAIGLLPLLGPAVTDMVLSGEQKRPLWRWKGKDRARPLGKDNIDWDVYYGGTGTLRERERRANSRPGLVPATSRKRAPDPRMTDTVMIAPFALRCTDLHPTIRRKYPTMAMAPYELWRKP